MSYSQTLSNTTTFTLSDAKYLASRIATDLTQMRLLYGKPTEQRVQDYAIEAAMLLKFGLLSSVKYGFQLNGNWIYAINYSVNYLGQLQTTNDDPGDIPSAEGVASATWHSFLTTRHNSDLSQTELDSINSQLPISRNNGDEPGSSHGTWVTEKTYSKNGVAMTRSYFRSS